MHRDWPMTPVHSWPPVDKNLLIITSFSTSILYQQVTISKLLMITYYTPFWSDNSSVPGHSYSIYLHCSFLLQLPPCSSQKLSQYKHLLWFRFHQRYHTALMSFEVSIKQWRPSIFVHTVNLVPWVEQKLNTLCVSWHGCKMKARRAMTVLIGRKQN